MGSGTSEAGSSDPLTPSLDNPHLSRRWFLLGSGAAVAGAFGAAWLRPTSATAQVPTRITASAQLSGLWPGHQVGQTYIGMDRTNLLPGHAASRSYRTPSQWSRESTEHNRITAEHAAGLLPWVSIKPPGGGESGWNQIAAGQHDAVIRQRARRYADYTLPVLSTFHHEPYDDGSAGAWLAAFFHIADVMADEVGSLGPVTLCPVLHGHNITSVGGAWLPNEMIDRCPIIGIDMYSRAGQTSAALDYLENRGVRSVGIGEFGRGTAGSRGGPFTVAEFEAKLDLFRDRRDLLSVVCYWNSGNHSFTNPGWPNGAAHLAAWNAYRAETCRLSEL
jgi:hypothetical protein